MDCVNNQIYSVLNQHTTGILVESLPASATGSPGGSPGEIIMELQIQH